MSEHFVDNENIFRSYIFGLITLAHEKLLPSTNLSLICRPCFEIPHTEDYCAPPFRYIGASGVCYKIFRLHESKCETRKG